MKTKAFIINTGSGRNIGDLAMLMNTIKLLKANHFDQIYVSEDFPISFQEEFEIKKTPLLFHCFGRLNSPKKNKILQYFQMLTSIGISLIVCFTLLLYVKLIKKELPFKFMECKMINSILNSDIIIFSGGGYLTDKGMLECRSCLLTGIIGIFLDKEVIFVGQGIGPIDTWITKKLLTFTINHSNSISIRDKYESLHLLKNELSINEKKIELTPDSAITLTKNTCQIFNNTSGKNKKLACHIRISPFTPNKSKLTEKFQSLLDELIKSGWHITFFIFASQKSWELDLINNFMSNVSKEHYEVIIDIDPRSIINKIQKCDVAVGIAYHFSVFSLMQGIPTIGLFDGVYYHQKMKGLFDWFNKKEWIVPYSNVSVNELKDKIDYLYTNKSTYYTELKNITNDLSYLHDSIFKQSIIDLK